MKEKLITFETVKLAKEKGYDVLRKYGVSTQSLLKKWLIEKHSLYAHIWPTFQYKTKPSWFYLIQDLKNGAAIMTQIGEPHKSYEDALEEALQQALKLVV